MKKKKAAIYVLFGLVILLLLFSGCGGGGKGGGTVKANIQGRIVDQNGEGVPGVRVTLGGNSEVTDSTGAFEFIGVATGQAQITGSGGSEDHYVVEPTTIVLKSGDNILDPIKAYRMIGCGVVVQSVSASDGAGFRLAGFNTVLPDIKGRLLFSKDDLAHAPEAIEAKSSRETKKAGEARDVIEELRFGKFNGMINFSTSGDFILDNDTFFLINWEPIAQAQNYEILFIGRDGKAETVWRSQNDPDFDKDDPTAHLHLAAELKDCGITGAGSYQFRIFPLDGSGQRMSQLPDIRISLGMMLIDYPRNLNVQNGQTLAWSAVPGADGYRVSIYDSDDELVYRSDVRELITGTELQLPGNLEAGEYYMYFVDAHALDDTGWSAEISRGISGFIY